MSNLEFLGSGTQGSVYKIDEMRCIKIFKKKRSCNDELHSLLLSQIDNHFPKLYSYGDNYIIREYINGTELDKYLSNHKLTKDISCKILELYNSMYYVGFTRLDCALFHIFLTPSNNLRLIDTAKAMKKSYSYPHIIINSLNTLGYKDEFLKFVQSNNPDIYDMWKKYI